MINYLHSFQLASHAPNIDQTLRFSNSRLSPRSQPFPSRSRLYGLPLADRHAALNAACSLRHRLPRRALVSFYCRLILGKDVAQLKVTKTLASRAPRQGGAGRGGRGDAERGTRPSDRVASAVQSTGFFRFVFVFLVLFGFVLGVVKQKIKGRSAPNGAGWGARRGGGKSQQKEHTIPDCG